MNRTLLAVLVLLGLMTHTARAQERDTLVDVGGYRLHFRVVPGHGLPILFDAGGGNDGTIWDSLLPPIARITGAPLITYDRAGFGKSEIDRRTTDIDSHGIVNGVEGLRAGLRKLGYGGNIVVVAHSYGALYETLYASRHPTLVKAAVLIDGATACWFNDTALSYVANEWKKQDTVKVKTTNPGMYYQTVNLPKTVAVVRSAPFPSTIPVIDLVSAYPPFSDSSDNARWRDCHHQFVAGHANRKGITARGTTHYIFQDNPPLVIDAIAKAYAGAVGQPEARAIAERDRPYAIAGAQPPPPGRLVDLGDHHLHINCTGAGTPTVVVENGLGDFSFDWTLVQGKVARLTRVCTYDRAGYGWSDPGPKPRTFAQINLELRDALSTSGEHGPYVLVGHSYGGPVVRNFALTYPHDVAGMVLVDAAFEGERVGIGGGKTMRLGEDAKGRPIPAPREDLKSDDHPSDLPMVNPERATTLDPMYRVLPDSDQRLQRWAQSQPFIADAEHSQLDWSGEYFARWLKTPQQGSLGSMPLVVMTRAEGKDGSDAARLEGQAKLVTLSSHGRQVIVQSGHNMELEAPDDVVKAIGEVVKLARH